MRFLSPASAWFFLLLVPLVAFYFLKLKRPRQIVPSLVLWRQVLNDDRVNSPFQRFKRNVLLWLQILLLTLLVLGAMQPLWRGAANRDARLPILIDVSASMGAIDDGAARLTAAKRRAREIIDGIASDQEICLISFGDTAQRLTPFTDNRRELHRALEDLAVEDVSSNVEEALRLAQALGKSAPLERVVLISDGNLPQRANFELPFAVDYQKIGGEVANCGITAFNARRALAQRWDVFIEIGSSAGSETSGGVIELLREGKVIGKEPVIVRKGSNARLTLTLADPRPGLITARFIPNGLDAVASDNIAFLELPEIRSLVVWVAPALTAIRHALEAMDDLQLHPDSEGTAPPAAFDLAFVDRLEDLKLPARVLCSLGVIPPELQPLLTVSAATSAPVDWRRESPLLQHVTFRDVILMDEPVRASGVTESSFADLGFDVLLHGARGPLLVEKHEREEARIHFLFHPDRSTLPYRVGFPVLVANIVRAALTASHLAEGTALRTGVLPSRTLRANTTYAVQTPEGEEMTVRSDERGALRGIAAKRVGLYVIRGGDTEIHTGASLLSADETSLAAVDAIELDDHLQITAAPAASARRDRALWWPLALVGFFVLLVEWWFYHRRPATVAA
jgi:hypothetical protein